MRITLEGSWKAEFDHRLREHTTLTNIIQAGSISRQQAYMIHSIHYKPGITYALQHTRFTSVQCEDLQKPVVNALLPKMGFSRKMARAVVYGPRRLGGLEFIHIETEQFCLQLQYLVKCLSQSTLQTREYLHLTAAYQQYLGTKTQFFNQEPTRFCYKPLNSKLTFLWTKLKEYDLRISSSILWTPHSKYENDQTIMDEVLTKQVELCGTLSAFSDRMIHNTNTVRLYLKCTFASDITDITTGLIIDDMINGVQPHDQSISGKRQTIRCCTKGLETYHLRIFYSWHRRRQEHRHSDPSQSCQQYPRLSVHTYGRNQPQSVAS